MWKKNLDFMYLPEVMLSVYGKIITNKIHL